MSKTEELRVKFLKVFANLPLGIRVDIIAVIDKQPMTWYVCWLEVVHKTKKSEEILKYLDELEFI